MSIQAKAIAGASWTLSGRLLEVLVNFATLGILARLLSPKDLGAVALTGSVMALITILSECGIAAALVRAPSIHPALLSTAFWFNFGLGVLGTVLLASAAGPIAGLMHEASLAELLRVQALSIAITQLGSTQCATLERGLRFRGLVMLETAAMVVGCAAAVASAYAGFGVWSLVVQLLLTALLKTLSYWLVCGWRPSWTFDRTELAAILDFSLSLTAFNLLNFVARNTDYFLIGRYLGTAALGPYGLAYRIMMLPLHNLTYVIQRTFLPSMVALRSDLERLRYAYLRTVYTVALIAMPVMLGLGAVAEPAVRLLFGDRWDVTADILKILGPLGAVQAVLSCNGILYKLTGRTDIQLRWSFVTSTATVLSFVWGLRYGPIGVAACYALVYLLLVVPSLFIASRTIDLRLSELASHLLPVTLSSLAMAGAVRMLLPLLNTLSPLLQTCAACLVGATIFAALIYLFQRERLQVFYGPLLVRALNELDKRRRVFWKPAP